MEVPDCPPACRQPARLREAPAQMATGGPERVEPCPVRALAKPRLRDVTKHRVWNGETCFLSPRSGREIT